MKLEQLLTSITASLKKLVSGKTEEPQPEPSNDKASRSGELLKGIEAIRDDLAKFGTGVGLLSGGLTTAAVLATLDALFPIPAAWQSLLWLAVGLLLVAALGSALLTRRYFAARRRIVVETSVLSPYLTNDIRNAGFRDWANLDRPLPERVFLTAPLNAYAAAELAPNIQVLELRIHRLDRVAARFTAAKQDELAKLASAESARLLEGIDFAVNQGAVSLIEYRSADVYKGWKTVALAMCVAISIGGLFVIADWSKGERERITEYLACHKDLSDDSATALCAQLDPKRLPGPSELNNPKPSASASASASASTSESTTPAPEAVVEALSSCANVSYDPSRVPNSLREQALAVCAGLPLPERAPSPSPTGSR